MIKNINHITLAVTDLEESFYFYKEVLGLKPLVKWNMGAYFLAGNEESGIWFCLNVDSSHKVTPCYTHYAFSVDQNDFLKIKNSIIKYGATIFKDNVSPGDSVYFLDPDGHKLELHVGTWRDRIEAKKIHPGTWSNITWFI